MGAIAKYRIPDDFDGLVDAVRAFVLVDLGLGIESDHADEEEKCPHHCLAVEGCRARIEVVADAGMVKVVTGDEVELLDIVRGHRGGPPLMSADKAVRLLLDADATAAGGTSMVLTESEAKIIKGLRRGDVYVWAHAGGGKGVADA